MPSDDPQHELLEAARGGDEHAFRRLLEPHRTALHACCYRMLGSLADADDALQHAMLGAWQGLRGFAGRSSLRTWLYTIATHACLRLGETRSRRVLSPEYGPSADPRAPLAERLAAELWVEPYPDDAMGLACGVASPEARYEQRESVELAFVAALQHLPATQRAVLILRDVLGFSAQECAHALDTSVAAANSALQRARQTLERRRPVERSRIAGAEVDALVERFVAAWSRADVDAIVAMLAEDAVFAMPPLPAWFEGRADIHAFLAHRVFALRWRFLAARASNQPALAAYQWNETNADYRLDVLNVLELRGDRIAAITAFLDPAVHGRFGLPEIHPG